ncbi:hypothetical protein [Aurantiacibacter gilvus]|uniref:Protein TonB n=1 Tax=Aurantiacibacter gilvus TaxID=3139141 RepID=A0ABU9IGR4_9SPHN
MTIASHPQTAEPASRWQSARLNLRQGLSRRAPGIVLTLAIEAVFILLLLSLGLVRDEPERETVPITTFDIGNPPEPAEAEEESEQAPAPASAPPVAAAPEQPVSVDPALPDLELPALVPRRTQQLPVPPPSPQPTPSASPTIGVRIREGSSYGPADTGSSRGEDSNVVGTAPDGSPLYAARWYREPRDSELAGYLSTARSTGWGLIACKTAPNWRVVDCEVVDEYPQGSGIARATQAAAWQFQVRPPRIGGQYQVGSWVRIRIDYGRTQRTL